MEFDQNNEVVQLCVRGMELEGQGQPAEASTLFNEAWNKAANDFEKFTAAHYIARHQPSTTDKLKWDTIALTHALNIRDETVREALPSLYLNIAKGYEDLKDFDKAKKHYQTAASVAGFLSEDGYGAMIRNGIQKGLERVS